MSYKLIRCYDNAAPCAPEYFYKHEDAFNTMCEYAASVANIPVDTVKSAITPDGVYSYTDAMCIHRDSAWVCGFRKHFKCSISSVLTAKVSVVGERE